jgi:hypothetical protein
MNENISSVKESTGNKVQLTEGHLLKLAYTLGLGMVNTVSIRSHSDLGNRREFIECGIHGKGHVEYSQMVIDYRDESPHLDQVYNLAYGEKATCPNKVILFTEEKQISEFEDPSAGIERVTGLVKFLNKHGARINLVKSTRGSAQEFACKVLVNPGRSSAKCLPSEIFIRNTEFWYLYFYSYNSQDITDGETNWWHCYGFRWDCNGSLFSDNFEVLSYWDETGLGYCLKDRNMGNDVKAVIEVKWDKLKSLYPNYNVISDDKYGPVEIRAIDKPIEWLLYSTSENKKEIAQKLRKEMGRILRFMDDAFEDIKLKKYTTPQGLLQI